MAVNKLPFMEVPLKESKGYGEDTSINVKKERKVKRLVHFSDGVLEEYSTDEDETDTRQEKKKFIDPKALAWIPYIWFHMSNFGSKTLSVCDYFGERIAWVLGITSPKYQYELDEAKRMAKEEANKKVKEDEEYAGWKMKNEEDTPVYVQEPQVKLNDGESDLHLRSISSSPEVTSPNAVSLSVDLKPISVHQSDTLSAENLVAPKLFHPDQINEKNTSESFSAVVEIPKEELTNNSYENKIEELDSKEELKTEAEEKKELKVEFRDEPKKEAIMVEDEVKQDVEEDEETEEEEEEEVQYDSEDVEVERESEEEEVEYEESDDSKSEDVVREVKNVTKNEVAESKEFEVEDEYEDEYKEEDSGEESEELRDEYEDEYDEEDSGKESKELRDDPKEVIQPKEIPVDKQEVVNQKPKSKEELSPSKETAMQSHPTVITAETKTNEGKTSD